jgi:hypothetical protein
LLLSGGLPGRDLPVARIISIQPFDVDGITAPASNFVPVSIGSQVSTKDSPAVIQFVDGTSITLQANSTLRIQGQPSSLAVRIVRGSAQYGLAPGSRLRVSTETGSVVNTKLDRAVFQANTASRAVAPTATYRSMRSRSGEIRPAMVASLEGSRVIRPIVPPPSVGSFSQSVPSIVTPGGLVMSLAPITDAGGNVTGYTLTGFTHIVHQPNGQITQVNITSGSIIGATVTGTQTGSTANIQFTLVGQSTPLTPAQVNQSFEQALTTALNTGIQNGTIQPGSTVSPSPVSVATFSSSAP